MDKHPKDYVVPNFGVNHDIITTKSNLKNAETKLGPWVVPKALGQRQSIPACNFAYFPKCLKAETAAPWKLQADQDKHPKDYVFGLKLVWFLNIKICYADTIDGLVIEDEGNIGMFEKIMGREDGVVWLNKIGGHLLCFLYDQIDL